MWDEIGIKRTQLQRATLLIGLFGLYKTFLDATVRPGCAGCTMGVLAKGAEEVRRREEVIHEDVICDIGSRLIRAITTL
jgi:hypothetical protein